MSINLFAYLETAPSLDDMRASLASLGVVYRHTLPPDDRWGYSMHVFGREGLRVVYHAGDPLPQTVDVLIAGAATVDLSHPRAASIATGFTMCVGAFGAIFSGAGIGYLKDLGHGNWSLVFQVLAAMPLLPAMLLVLLWNLRPRNPVA